MHWLLVAYAYFGKILALENNLINHLFVLAKLISLRIDVLEHVFKVDGN